MGRFDRPPGRAPPNIRVVLECAPRRNSAGGTLAGMRRFLEDLLLLLEEAVASAKTSELVPPLGAQALAAASSISDWRTQCRSASGEQPRSLATPEIVPAQTDQAYPLLPELGRVRRMGSASQRGLLPGAVAPSLKVSTKAGELQT
jgi:hypothetical protein